MLLNEFLESHQGQTVYIGSGSAYVYMDRVTDETLLALANINGYYKDELLRIWQFQKRRDEQLPSLIANLEDRYDRLPGLIEESRGKLHIAEKQLAVMKRSKKEYLIEDAQHKYDSIYEITTRLINERKRIPRRIKNLKHEQKIMPAKLAKLEHRYNDYIPFAERKIKNAYLSYSTGANICIVEGHEIGKYWFEEEYHNPELLKKYEEENNDTERTSA